MGKCFNLTLSLDLAFMKVVSVNLSKPVTIEWNGKSITTGIYKKPVASITLDTENVVNDTVADRRVHGGPDKACYLYSADYYDYWKNIYPNLEWDYGMFGENITVSDMDEANLKIDSIYQLGEALISISQPRQPCYKLGVKFGNQKILKDFIQYGHPGTYVRILTPGVVKKGDSFELVEKFDKVSIQEVFSFMYHKR